MADREFSQFTAGGTGQAPTDTLVGLDLSLPAADQNSFWTLNNLFSVITRNITDGALRFGGFAAPSLSGAGTGALYFDSSANVFKVSSNGGAFVTLGDISGTFTATGQVAVANGTKSVTGSNGLTYASGALTVGESGTAGGVRLVANSGNYWNIASSTPAGNRTFYFPDSITPTTGNFLFVGTFGATVVTDWSTGLTWSNTTKQLTVTASLNDVIGLGVQNTSAGTAAQCQVGFTANGGAISLLSLTGTNFSTSGIYHANQLYWRGTTGITDITFALDDASTNFRFAVNNAVAASINATSTESLVLGIASSLTGRVKLFNSAGATYTQISAGNAAANLNYILPATSPTAGQFLQAGAPSGGNVTLTWATGGGGAPTNASYLVLSLNGTLTDERVFTLADTTLTEVDGGAGGNYTLGVNQANAFTWTAAHDWQTGTSQSNAIRLLKASIGATGQRDSDRFLWQAKANDGSEHTIEARGYINVVGNDGVGSLWTLDGRLDGGFNTLMTVNISSGVVTAIGGLVAGVASTTTGSLLMYHASGATSTTISAGNAASSLNYIWPATDPSSGQVLTASAPSGGIVTLSWAAAGSGTIGGSIAANQVAVGSGSNTIAGSSTFTLTSGSLVLNSANAAAFVVGPNGTTNPTLSVVTNTASAATGVSITGAAAGSGATISPTSSGTNENLIFSPKGAGVIEQRNGTTAQVFNIFNTYTDSSNYERLTIQWAGGNAFITTNHAGTGSNKSLSIGTGGTGILRFYTNGNYRWNVDASGNLGPNIDNAYDLGAVSVIGRLKNAYVGTGILLGIASVGTSGAGVLAIGTTNIPTTSPADTAQVYSFDAAAGDHNLFARNEAGEIARLTGNTAYVTTQFDKTSDTTLANVTGLSRNVQASTRYNFTATIYTSSNSAGGINLAIGGTATATNIIYDAIVTDAGVVQVPTNTRTTTLGNPVGQVTAVTAAKVVITGSILVNAAGTLTVQFAQNASNGTASSVLVGSSLTLGQT